MKPLVDSIKTPVTRRFASLASQFHSTGLIPEEVFVWYQTDNGSAEAIIVIEGKTYQGSATGDPMSVAESAVLDALQSFISLNPLKCEWKKRKKDPLLEKQITGAPYCFNAVILFKRRGRVYRGHGVGSSPDVAYGRAKKNGKLEKVGRVVQS